jgi:acetyl-CoA C-acetyltransferase
MTDTDVVIVSACRTAIGSLGGALSTLSAPKLGSLAIKETLTRAGVSSDQVDEVIMGNVLAAGLGQAPARQAALYAGLPQSVECLTINKMCGSGLKSVMLAAQAIRLGDADIIVAGGMESMTNAPYLLDKARSGYRLGHGKLLDSMIVDGLWDVYNDFHMGNAAELCARECNISRDMQDEYAVLSYMRAQTAIREGWFKEEIVPVDLNAGSKKAAAPNWFDTDEEPARVKFEKIPGIKPVFDKEGTVTAANASTINDGAAALLLASHPRSRELGLKPVARIVAQASFAKAPEWFTTAPADAIKKVLKKGGLQKEDIGLFEVNEAFAVVSIAVNQLAGLDPDKVNIHGGAVAMGHPIGASGARILVTLLHAMKRRNVRYGLAVLCIGGGEASAIIVERLQS